MQFPLRDFFWLSLVIGLAIGIAMEHKRVVETSVHEGRAIWWRKAAEETAKRLEKATGEAIQFDELKQLDITVPPRVQEVPVKGSNGEIVDTLKVPLPGYQVPHAIYARDTREDRISFLTGMMDLDMWIVMLVIGGPILVIFQALRKDKKPLTVFHPDNPLWKKTPWFALFWIPFCVLMSLNSYWFMRAPFNGALFLTLGVLHTYMYCQYVLGPRLQSKTEPGSQAAVQTES